MTVMLVPQQPPDGALRPLSGDMVPNSAPMPGGPPRQLPSLVEGLPDPLSVEEQKMKHMERIDEEFAFETAVLSNGYKANMKFIRDKHEQEKRRACASIEQQTLQTQLDIETKHAEQKLLLDQLAKQRQFELETQANRLTAEYAIKQKADEVAAMNYELHMEANSSDAPDWTRHNSFAVQVTDGLFASGLSGANSRLTSCIASRGVSPRSRQIANVSSCSQSNQAIPAPVLTDPGQGRQVSVSHSASFHEAVHKPQGRQVSVSHSASFHEGPLARLPRPTSFQSHYSAPAAFARDGLLFGALYAIVHGCYNLVINDGDDSGEVSDVLVVARLGAHEERTPSVNNDLHPIWSNDNRFRFRVGPAQAAALQLEVMDHTALRNLSLGTLSVPVNALVPGEWQRLRYPLKDGAGGELELDVRWEPEVLRH